MTVAGALTVDSCTGCGAGGGTLDQAYDSGGAGAGRTITVDSGAVTLDLGADNAGLVIQANGTQNTNLLEFQNSSGTVLSAFTGAGGLLMNISSTTALTVQNGSGTTLFRIDTTNSSVGIATTTSDALFSIENTGSGKTVHITDQANDTTPFVIDAAGNVGIGTAAPTGGLQVSQTNVGTARAGYNNGGSSGTSYAIFGQATGISGTAYGVYGDTGSNPDTTAYGVGALLVNANGEALRIYTSDGTTGKLVNINHAGSTFTNDALIFDMADGSGTFSGRFINAMVNNVTRFAVGNAGNMTASSTITTTNFLSASSSSITTGHFMEFTVPSTGFTGDALRIQTDSGADGTPVFQINGSGSATTTGTLYLSGLTTETGAVTSALCLDSNNQVTKNTENETCVASSEEFKFNIESLSPEEGLDLVNQLRAVSFEYKNNPGALHYGFIAEEVAEVNDGLVSHKPDGSPFTVKYISMIGILTKAVQDLDAKLEEQELNLAELDTEGLNMDGFTTIPNGLVADKIGSSKDFLTLLSDTEFIGRPYFNQDTAGFAVVTAGEREVEVVFDQQYLEQPIVNVTLTVDDDPQIESPESEQQVMDNLFNLDFRYAVGRKSIKGFSIYLDKSVGQDLKFSWTALAVKNAKIFSSDIAEEVEAEEPAPALGEEPAQTETPVEENSEGKADNTATTTFETVAADPEPEAETALEPEQTVSEPAVSESSETEPPAE